MFWDLEDDDSIRRISSSPKWDIHRIFTVGYICLKLRKNNKAGKSYQKPSRHQCLGIQRWLLVQGAPSLPGEPEGQWEGMCSMVVSPGSHKNTKERNQEYVLSPTIAMKETTPGR